MICLTQNIIKFEWFPQNSLLLFAPKSTFDYPQRLPKASFFCTWLKNGFFLYVHTRAVRRNTNACDTLACLIENWSEWMYFQLNFLVPHCMVEGGFIKYWLQIILNGFNAAKSFLILDYVCHVKFMLSAQLKLPSIRSACETWVTHLVAVMNEVRQKKAAMTRKKIHSAHTHTHTRHT